MKVAPLPNAKVQNFLPVRHYCLFFHKQQLTQISFMTVGQKSISWTVLVSPSLLVFDLSTGQRWLGVQKRVYGHGSSYWQVSDGNGGRRK